MRLKEIPADVEKFVFSKDGLYVGAALVTLVLGYMYFSNQAQNAGNSNATIPSYGQPVDYGSYGNGGSSSGNSGSPGLDPSILAALDAATSTNQSNNDLALAQIRANADTVISNNTLSSLQAQLGLQAVSLQTTAQTTQAFLQAFQAQPHGGSSLTADLGGQIFSITNPEAGFSQTALKNGTYTNLTNAYKAFNAIPGNVTNASQPVATTATVSTSDSKGTTSTTSSIANTINQNAMAG